MNKKESEKRTTITFDAGSTELKEKAVQFAKNFQLVKISLSSLCRLALEKYLKEDH